MAKAKKEQEQTASGLKAQIENEIREYQNGYVNISEGFDFSQAKLVRRIGLFENHIYPTGKFTANGDYKFWFDMKTSRINAEIKNIDFDTKDILAHSDRKIDELPNIIVNLTLKEWLRQNGQADEINAAIEEGSGWGNVVWKKVRGGYERVDLKNFMVINQTAFSLKESPTIERHQYSQSELRAMSGKWKNVQDVVEGCKEKSYSATNDAQSKETTVPYYLIFERNGEVCLYDLLEERGEDRTEEDRNKFVLAKVIVAGTKGNGGAIEIKYVVYADSIPEMPFEEYHRGRYKGRWFREGIIELLFDIQVRCNQIGNQIAQGLEYASKIFFQSTETLIVQNVMSDLKNGDLLKAKDIKQIEVNLQGFGELASDWNRMVQLANEICNSQEVVQGTAPVGGTPLGTTKIIDMNSNKLFDFLREKLEAPLSRIFENWIVPQLVSELKAKDILRLTGDSDMLGRLCKFIVDAWYIENLVSFPPHTKEFADQLKAEKMDELKKRPELLMQGIKDAFEDYKAAVSIIIHGENSRLAVDMENMAKFVPLIADPIRRDAMVEKAMMMSGIDVASLPKSPEPLPGQMPGAGADAPLDPRALPRQVVKAGY